MKDSQLPKKVLEWREKNKLLLEEKIKTPRGWQEILTDIKKWCDGIENENKRNK